MIKLQVKRAQPIIIAGDEGRAQTTLSFWQTVAVAEREETLEDLKTIFAAKNEIRCVEAADHMGLLEQVRGKTDYKGDYTT